MANKKSNVQVSFGLSGMERQNFEHLLDDKVFTFQRNGLVETDENTLGLTNEMSNLLCNRFKSEMMVVGHKYDVYGGKVYFFLTDRETHENPQGKKVRKSEIGYIKVNNTAESTRDIEVDCGCSFEFLLDTPLEDTEQIPHCVYTTLVSDECNNCLNFDPNYPIRDIVIKREACGLTMSFTDGLNPPRYIVLNSNGNSTDIDWDFYGKVGEKEPCTHDTRMTTCLDCDKLRVFPLYSAPCLTPEVLHFGGNLKMGNYEVYVAYCDKLGRELSPYFSATNPIRLFDFNRNYMEQINIADRTNLGIRLQLKDLDKRFSYYRLAIVTNTDVNNITGYYLDKVRTTSEKSVSLTSGDDWERTTLEHINATKPNYKTWGGLLTANNYLMGYDYDLEEEWNLQPVVNLMGSMIRWGTTVSDEDLYKDGVNCSLYTSFFRDEVYPLSIRFITDEGYITSVFPLISRTANEHDLEIVVGKNDKNVESILENKFTKCSSNERRHRWQFYNTATDEGHCNDMCVGRGTEEEGEIVTTTQKSSCTIPNVTTIEKGQIELPVDTEFNSVVDWISLNNDYIKKYVKDTLGDDVEALESKHCDLNSSEYNKSKCGLIRLYKALTHDYELVCPQNWEDDNPFQYKICDECEKNACDTPTLKSVRIVPSIIEGEHTELVPKELSEYKHEKNLTKCDVFEKEDGDYVLHETIHIKDSKVYKRNEEANEHTDCDDKGELNSKSQFWNVYRFGSTDEAKTNFKSVGKGDIFVGKGSGGYSSTVYCVGEKPLKAESEYTFLDRVHKGAKWYGYKFEEGEKSVIVEISPTRKTAVVDKLTNEGEMRYTIFKDCDSVEYISTGFFDTSEGLFLEILKSEINSNEFIIALDSPMINIPEVRREKVKLPTDGDQYGECDKVINNYYQTAVKGCLNVNKVEIQYKSLKVTFDRIVFDKIMDYETKCRVVVPIANSCNPGAHRQGKFAYWESTERYPDNRELYDSSFIKMRRSDFKNVPQSLISDFEKSYVEKGDDNYVWKSDSYKSLVDFTCRNIRHFKFPDNRISPFMSGDGVFAKSAIYPLGISVNPNVVQSLLDVAVNNGLITKKQRDSIRKFEIFRGNRLLHKSVIARGIVNDMYKDELNSKDGKQVYFRNFPYNTLGSNAFLLGSGDKLLKHPYDSQGNDRFSFISPEVYYNRPRTATEITIDGYMYGNAQSKFKTVKGHPEWTILSSNAKTIATTLSLLEIASEGVMTYYQMKLQESYNHYKADSKVKSTAVGSLGTLTTESGYKLHNPKARTGGLLLKMLIPVLGGAIFKFHRYRSQWLQSFEDLGPKYNFSKMYISPEGFYNRFQSVYKGDENNLLRGLVDGFKFLKPGVALFREGDDYLEVNNVDRENSIYLNVNKHKIEYPKDYIKWDNYDSNSINSSRYVASDIISSKQKYKRNFLTGDGKIGILGASGLIGKATGLLGKATDGEPSALSSELDELGRNSNVASPYVTLKNYVPNQYGTIGDIEWLSVNNCGNLKTACSCEIIYGGDCIISRVEFKNKFPIFNTTAMKVGNSIGFDYKRYPNVGKPRFWISYKVSDYKSGGTAFLDSDMNVDQYSSEGKYVRLPSKFYLYAYGVPRFLVESEINCNFRYAGKEPHEQFASNGINVEDWVQEDNVSIAYNNLFYYNNAYSKPQTGLAYRVLPEYYNKKKWSCLSKVQNSLTYSEQDNSEISLDDPWLVYKPFNVYNFPTSYGKLINMRSIESQQVLGLFENNAVLFNAVDTLRDRLTPESTELGAGGMFASRPLQFSHTDLGETGTQHKAFVSCQFGHFWTDAKRGKIFQLQPNGKGLSVISDFNGGKESGMRKWFKKHLPFKILHGGIHNLSDSDLDNPYKGLGIVMWWDDRFKRVFITKLDFAVTDFYQGKIRYSNGRFFVGDEEVKLTDTKYFEDVSWTVAYSPLYKGFISYYDFKPQYAISYNNYFQTGLNIAKDSSEIGLWSHLLTNRSYQVFYGKYYSWEIEVPIKNEYTNKILDYVNIWTTSKRYHRDSEYAIWKNKSFNKGIIYNQTNNSGVMIFDYVTSYNKADYPKKHSSISQIIPVTHMDNKININYFYNRVYNIENHVPIWDNDRNEIQKWVNPKAVSFYNKQVLERIRGEWFKVYLRMDHSSQFQHVFKWIVSVENKY